MHSPRAPHWAYTPPPPLDPAEADRKRQRKEAKRAAAKRSSDHSDSDEERPSEAKLERAAFLAAEKREWELADNVQKLQRIMDLQLNQLEATRRTKEVLTARLHGVEPGAPGPDLGQGLGQGLGRGLGQGLGPMPRRPSGGPSLGGPGAGQASNRAPGSGRPTPPMSAREREFHERGVAVYGDAWFTPPEGGGLSMSEIMSIPEDEMKSLQDEARRQHTARETERNKSFATRADQFSTPREAAVPVVTPAVRSLGTHRSRRESSSRASGVSNTEDAGSRPGAGVGVGVGLGDGGTAAGFRVKVAPPSGPPPIVPKLDLSRLRRVV